MMRLPKYRLLLQQASWLLAIVVSLSLMNFVHAESAEFDHFETGFPLTGEHRNVECDQCHDKGQFQGTPVMCDGCHNDTDAAGKPIDHIQSDDRCDDCHTTVGWHVARFDHGTIESGCFSCHNGSAAQGKDSDHISTGNTCEFCHTTFSWGRVSRVDH
ncbi:MAG: cytochrome c3 family protein, partial [Candidatus Thiodiazotropha taylori]|nr:cytochrome c3 family protein [Candidatus Thiodiazotropha taylori]